jgi:hypothetical protein
MQIYSCKDCQKPFRNVPDCNFWGCSSKKKDQKQGSISGIIVDILISTGYLTAPLNAKQGGDGSESAMAMEAKVSRKAELTRQRCCLK